MKFRAEWDDGVPNVIFEGEEPPRSWLLAFFLEDARNSVSSFLTEIEKVKRGEKVPTGFTCNHVDVEFYPNRAVIEHLYPVGGEDAEPETTELSLDEAEQLLLDWQAALNEWRVQHA